jgi:putative transposase
MLIAGGNYRINLADQWQFTEESTSKRTGITRARVAEACAALNLGKSQFYEALRRYRADPRTSSLVLGCAGAPRGKNRLAPDIEAMIERCIDALYLSEQKLTAAALFEAVEHECRKANLKAPSLKAVRRRIQARPAREVITAREGRAVAEQRFRPVPGHLESTWPLDLLQIDHTPLDLIIVDDIARKPIGRPWLTLALDVHTRTVAGFLVSLDPPSATSVALAVAHAVLPKEAWLAARSVTLPWSVAGLPRCVHVDNAREFHSQAFERGCRQHGIQIEYRPVRTPRYGGHIERLMGTLMGRIHALPGTTFSNTCARGAADPEAAAVLTLGEFEAVFTLEVLGPYHMEVHSALGIPPLAAWAERLSARPSPLIQPGDATAFFRNLLPFKDVAVRREGIRLHSIFYYDDVLTTWLGSGTRMRVKYDPRDLSCVFLEDVEGRHWPIRYRELARPPITLWEQRAAVRELRERGKGLVDEVRIFEAIEARRALVEEAAAKTMAARREVQRTAHLRMGQAIGQPAEIPTTSSQGSTQEEPEDARVPMPTEADRGSVEEWT